MHSVNLLICFTWKLSFFFIFVKINLLCNYIYVWIVHLNLILRSWHAPQVVDSIKLALRNYTIFNPFTITLEIGVILPKADCIDTITSYYSSKASESIINKLSFKNLPATHFLSNTLNSTFLIKLSNIYHTIMLTDLNRDNFSLFYDSITIIPSFFTFQISWFQ